MNRSQTAWVVAGVCALVMAMPAPVLADVEIGAISVLEKLTGGAVQGWAREGLRYARVIFWYLVPLHCIYRMKQPVMTGADLGGMLYAVTSEFARVGLFYSMLDRGEEWIHGIVVTLKELGKRMASSGPSVGDLFDQLPGNALDLCKAILKVASDVGFVEGLAVAGGAITVGVMLIIAWGIHFLSEVNAHLAVGMGAFLLGFGGASWTSQYVWGYVKYAAVSGMHLMSMELLGGLFENIVVTWVELIQQPGKLAEIETVLAVSFGTLILTVTMTVLPVTAAAMVKEPAVRAGHGVVAAAIGAAAKLGAQAAAGYGLGGAVAKMASSGGGAGGGASMSAAQRAAAATGLDAQVWAGQQPPVCTNPSEAPQATVGPNLSGAPPATPTKTPDNSPQQGPNAAPEGEPNQAAPQSENTDRGGSEEGDPSTASAQSSSKKGAEPGGSDAPASPHGVEGTQAAVGGTTDATKDLPQEATSSEQEGGAPEAPGEVGGANGSSASTTTSSAGAAGGETDPEDAQTTFFRAAPPAAGGSRAVAESSEAPSGPASEVTPGSPAGPTATVNGGDGQRSGGSKAPKANSPTETGRKGGKSS